MNIGDYVTVRYHIPTESEFGPLNDYYYGQIINIHSNGEGFDYEVIAKSIGDNSKITIHKKGISKSALKEHIVKINSSFSWSDIEKIKS